MEASLDVTFELLSIHKAVIVDKLHGLTTIGTIHVLLKDSPAAEEVDGVHFSISCLQNLSS